MKPEEIKLYFERLGLEYDENAPRNAQLLAKLQYAHVTSVPYETTEIVDRHPLSLEYEDLFRKIVTERRGGYCFELNGLFCCLLRALGYKADEYFARFLRGEDEPPKPRHRVICAEADGKTWLCDVGVGCKAPKYPVELTPGLVQEQGDEKYRISQDDFLGYVLEEDVCGECKPYFSFVPVRQLAKDFTTPSFYCENHPDSPFLCNMISLKTADGRYTIDKNTFRIWKGDTVLSERTVTDDELETICKDYFGMTLHR